MKNPKISPKNNVNKGKRYGSRCFNKLGWANDFMQEAIKMYDKVRFVLSNKLALKTQIILI
jgi:hypothetical protein